MISVLNLNTFYIDLNVNKLYSIFIGGEEMEELKMFSVRLPKDLIKELKLEAVKNDTTAQLIVEKALKEYFAKK